MQNEITIPKEKAPLLQEQEAPEKNTDNAFVTVNGDGSPGLDKEQKDDETAPPAEPKK